MAPTAPGTGDCLIQPCLGEALQSILELSDQDRDAVVYRLDENLRRHWEH